MTEHVTGAQLLALAKKQIDKKTFNQAIGETHFNDFVRICILMSLAATMAPDQPSSFGHTFTVRNQETKEFFDVDFDIKVTSRKRVVL